MVVGPAASTSVRGTHTVAWAFIIDISYVKASGRGLVWRTALKFVCSRWENPKHVLGRMSCVRIEICAYR